MDIAQPQELDYESVKIERVGFADPYGIEGLVVLRSIDGKELYIGSFSGESSRYIACMIKDEKKAIMIPSIYDLVSEICENNEIILVKTKIYQTGDILRANLYFTGKQDMILKNYRASDAIILSVLYKIPILVRRNLLKSHDEIIKEQDTDIFS